MLRKRFDVKNYVVQKFCEVKENKDFERVVVEYDQYGKVQRVSVCEMKILSERDFDRWQSRVMLSFSEKNTFKYMNREGKCLYTAEQLIDTVVDKVRREPLGISLCVRLLKKTSEKTTSHHLYLARVFNDYFFIRTEDTLPFDSNKRLKHIWVDYEGGEFRYAYLNLPLEFDGPYSKEDAVTKLTIMEL